MNYQRRLTKKILMQTGAVSLGLVSGMLLLGCSGQVNFGKLPGVGFYAPGSAPANSSPDMPPTNSAPDTAPDSASSGGLINGASVDPTAMKIAFAKGVPMSFSGSNILVLAKSTLLCDQLDFYESADCQFKSDYYGQNLHVNSVDSSGRVSEVLIQPRSGSYIVQTAVDGSDLVVLTADQPSHAKLNMISYTGEFIFRSLELYHQDDQGVWDFSSSIDLATVCIDYCETGADFHFAGQAKILSLKGGRILLVHQRFSADENGIFHMGPHRVEFFQEESQALVLKAIAPIHSERNLRPDNAMSVEQGDDSFAVLTEGLDSHYGHLHIYSFAGTNDNASIVHLTDIDDQCFDSGVRDQSQHIAYSGNRLYLVANDGIRAYNVSSAGAQQIGVTNDYRKSVSGSVKPAETCNSAVSIANDHLYIFSVTDFDPYADLSRAPEVSIYSQSATGVSFVRAIAVGSDDKLSPATWSWAVVGSSLILQENEALLGVRPQQIQIYSLLEN